MRFYTGNTEDISALILVDEYGTPIMGLPGAQFKETCNLPALDWYRQAMDAEIGETVLSRPHVQNLYPNSYPWVVSVLRKVRYNQDGEQNIGILMVDMRLEPLEEICRSVELGSSGCPYILSQDDEIIFHPDQKLLALELISEESIRTEEEDGADENTMVLSQDIAGTDWRLVGTVTAEDIAKNSSEFNSRMTGIVVCLAILVTAVAVWLSMQIVRPLTQMQTNMQRIERNLDDNRISLPEEGFAEYAALSHSYNVMLHKIRGLMKETVDRQEQLRRMVRETRISADRLIWPIFIIEGEGICDEIPLQHAGLHRPRDGDGPHPRGHRDGPGPGQALPPLDQQRRLLPDRGAGDGLRAQLPDHPAGAL